jgi:hypothetical protein
MAAYIIGMQKIVSLASQRKRVAAPRAEPGNPKVKSVGQECPTHTSYCNIKGKGSHKIKNNVRASDRSVTNEHSS